MSVSIKNLGDLIKSKGLLKYHVMTLLNKKGIQCNESTFSKWCTGKHKPQNLSAPRVISEILGVDEEVVLNLIK